MPGASPNQDSCDENHFALFWNSLNSSGAELDPAHSLCRTGTMIASRIARRAGLACLFLLAPLAMPVRASTITLPPEAPAVLFLQAEDGIRDVAVTGVQTCALPISAVRREKLTQDVAGAAGREQDVAGGEHRDEVIRGIRVAAEVGPEAAPRLVDGRRRQHAGADLEPWRADRVIDEDHDLALVVHVV